MANKFKNISLINEKDPTGIKKAGNNLLLGIGNVLDASSMAVGTEEQEETAEEEGDKSKFNATKVWDFVVLIFRIPSNGDLKLDLTPRLWCNQSGGPKNEKNKQHKEPIIAGYPKQWNKPITRNKYKQHEQPIRKSKKMK